jgi:exopolysaccharide biosynthesis predicted pyruvyltransferase EpsI
MKFNILKTRQGKLETNIQTELDSKSPDLKKIIDYVYDYEKNNLATIDKLKRDKVIQTKRISGALKSTIQAHGPITMILIGSATKRIHGSLLDNPKTEKKSFINRITSFIIKWIN